MEENNNTQGTNTDVLSEDNRTASDKNHFDLPEFVKNPQRRDKVLMGFLAASTILSFITMPFKGYLLNHPWVSLSLNGSQIAMIISGAHVKMYHASVIIPIILGVLGLMRFIVLYWFAGNYWGDDFLKLITNDNKRTIKQVKRAEKLANGHAFFTILLCNLPFSPLPASLISVFLGNARLSLKKFLAYNVITLLAVQSFNLYLGYRYGKNVIHVVHIIDQYMNYIFIPFVIYIAFSSGRSGYNSAKLQQARQKQINDDKIVL